MKYIFANVKIPIKVSDQNEYSIVSERIHTTIEPCHELPPVNENQSQGVFDQIESILSQSIGVEENTETDVGGGSEEKDERENKTKEDNTEVKLVLQQQHDFLKKNVTFRNRTAFKHNKSKKHRI